MAYRRALAKSLKIKELGITPDMTEDQIDGQVKYCAEMKALKEGVEDWKQYLKGQRWYVEDLVAFSKLDAQARLDLEYKNSFPDVATEQEVSKTNADKYKTYVDNVKRLAEETLIKD